MSFMPIMCCNDEGLRGSLGQKDRGVLGIIDIYKIAYMLIVIKKIKSSSFWLRRVEWKMEKFDELEEFHSNTCTHCGDKRVNYSFWNITIMSEAA